MKRMENCILDQDKNVVFNVPLVLNLVIDMEKC